MNRLACAALLLISGALTTAVAQEHVSGVNKNIRIQDGAQAKDVQTVNGGISIGSNASVGAVKSVNGKIEVDDNTRAQSIETVNGGVELDDGVQVEQGVKAVNGKIELGRGAAVGGDLQTANGSIELDHASVGGDLRTKNGDIDVGARSIVKGGIIMEKSERDHYDSKRLPRVVIGPGAIVSGALRFEREVQLYVSDSAQIGSVTGAKAIKFSGEEP